jgi:hypothetical protein
MPTRLNIRRPRHLFLIAAVIIIFLLIVGSSLAGIYTNYLWFHWTGIGEVWRLVTATKLALEAIFFVVAFALIFACLYLVDRVVGKSLFIAQESEFVQHYRQSVARFTKWIRVGVSLVIAFILASGTSSQWQHWLLFEHAVPFGQKDPIFGRDLSFFVFRMPLLSFLVDWMFSALVVALVVTCIAYILNGALHVEINPTRSIRVEPRAVAHISLLLSMIALERAWAYYFVDRYSLELSQHGVVFGATYTDVHVRLPAMTLLAIVSLVAFVLMAFNIYQRSFTMPLIAFGLWIFLAITVGAIYPALYQALKVTPSQSALERPYIQRNITATRAAMNLTGITNQYFPANQDLSAGVLSSYQQTLDDAQLWDPGPSQATYVRVQDKRSYYSLTDLAIDRYRLNGVLTPVDVGVRELYSAGVASQSWVNIHLQYTHGYGAVVAPSNVADSSGNPTFALGNIPATSTDSSVKLTQPDVYFAPNQNNYVIVDTKQPEVEYQNSSGSLVEGSYSGSGGIPIDSFLPRLAFSIRFHDLNLLISGEIDKKSRLINIPNAQEEVQKALPFMSVDTNPYAVIDNGHIDWIFDAYTESANYPYAQPADTAVLPSSSGLNGTYNYVRDAVKVVVNAYTGKMSFYTIDASADPLMISYEHMFPGMFKPLSSLTTTNPVLLQHLRYPQDLLMVQSAMYGRYHTTSPSSFYSLSNAWDISQTSTSADGNPKESLPIGSNGLTQRFTPIYELLQLPGKTTPSFNAVEPLVPYSANDKVQTLSALMLANSSYKNYGSLTAFQTPSGGTPIEGPQLVNASINSNPTISKQISLLNQGGSSVLFGAVQILPIADSLLYVRPLYVSSSQTNFPQLQEVVVDYGGQVAMEPTLGAALADVFGAGVSTTSGSSSAGTVPSEVRTMIASAVSDYQAAQTALGQSNLSTYQSDIEEAGQLITQAEQLLKPSVKKK